MSENNRALETLRNKGRYLKMTNPKVKKASGTSFGPCSLWVFWGQILIAPCSRIEEKVESGEPRTKRSLISEADVYPARMKNKTDWCEVVEKVTGARVISAKGDKTFLFQLQQSLCGWLPFSSFTFAPTIKHYVVIPAGATWQHAPCTLLMGSPCWRVVGVAILVLHCLFALFHSHYSPLRATTLPRLHRAINQRQRTLKTD